MLSKIDEEGRIMWAREEGMEEATLCELYKSVNDTSFFKRRDTDKVFNILKGLFDCNSHHVNYLLKYKQCQYLNLGIN